MKRTGADPKQAPRKRKPLVRGSTMRATKQPMARVSKTNSRAVAKAEQYPEQREAFLRAHRTCEMRITTPPKCTGDATRWCGLLTRKDYTRDDDAR